MADRGRGRGAGRGTSPAAREQRAAAARLLRVAAAPPPTAPTPAIRKGAEPTRPRTSHIRGGTDPATVSTVIASTVAKYSAEGWNTLIVPAPLIDFIAVRADRMHFVKIVIGDQPSVGWRNQYIQNALSNNAEPVYADADGTLTNMNEGRRVIIARRTPAAALAASADS